MTTIITKNSSTAGAAPLAADLVQGELAVNVTSKALYTKNAAAAVVKLNTPSIVDNGDATAITIDSSENVGIGTSSPAAKLYVSGPTGNGIAYTDSTVTTYMGVTGSVKAETGTVTNHPYAFLTNGAERARIDSSGNLLVGTTSYRGAEGTSIAGIEWSSNTTNTGFVARARFATNGTDVGFISTSGSGTTYSTSSDYRLKENISPMTGALCVVEALKPVTYTWKIDGSGGQGFIAHELQAVVPDCVTGEKDAVDADGNPIYQGIDTSFLVATLTAAIQEQQALINAQQAALTTLTERITALEAK